MQSEYAAEPIFLPNWVKHTDYRDGAGTLGAITGDGGEVVMDVNRDGRMDLISSGAGRAPLAADAEAWSAPRSRSLEQFAPACPGGR